MVKAEINYPYTQKINRKNKNGSSKTYYAIRHPMVARVTGTSGTDKPKKSIYFPPGCTPGGHRFHAFYDKWMVKLEAARQASNVNGPATGTVAHLIDMYMGNEKTKPHELWSDLKPKTKTGYIPLLEDIRNRWGTFDVRLLDQEMAAALRDTIRDRSGPRTANFMIAVMRNLEKIALEKKTTLGLDQNWSFATGIRRFGKKAGIKPRTIVWSDDDEKRFLDVALNGHGLKGAPDYVKPDRLIYRAFLIMIFTGQRLTDVLGMTTAQYSQQSITVYDDGVANQITCWAIEVEQEKTDTRVWIRAHRDLIAELDLFLAMNARKAVPSTHFLQGRHGRPFSAENGGFGKRWRKIALAAKCDGLQRRDLRRTCVTRLKEVGVSHEGIRDITGHSMKSLSEMMDIYDRRTGSLGSAAIVTLENRRKK